MRRVGCSEGVSCRGHEGVACHRMAMAVLRLATVLAVGLTSVLASVLTPSAAGAQAVPVDPEAAVVDPVRCNTRLPIADPEVIAALVEDQRERHATTTFVEDSIARELAHPAPVVPTAPGQMWGQPVPMPVLEPRFAFGWRTHPITGRSKFHNGLDISHPSGTPVRALADGVVHSTEWRGGYGSTVVIDHGDGFSTVNAHLSSVAVAAGDEVVGGDVVGAVGSTGRSTGPHLHFETRLGGVPVDPAWFVPDLVVAASDTATSSGPAAAALDHVAVGSGSARLQLDRLYRLVLERPIDATALAFYQEQCRVGVPLEDIAADVVASREFVALRGLDQGVIDLSTLLEIMAVDALGRMPSAEETSQWQQQLAEGDPSAAIGRIVVELSESAEYRDRLGIVLLDSSVARLYRAVLGRSPDIDGGYYWTELRDHGHELHSLAFFMSQSQEYTARFGVTDDRAFVERVYRLVFDREPDTAGLDYWAGIAGLTDRWTVLVEFSESPEGQRRLVLPSPDR